MEFENVLNSVMDFRSNYPEAVSGIIGVLGFLALYLIRRMLAASPLSPEAASLAGMLGVKSRWRWGVKGVNMKRGLVGTPTGNSIVCDGNGKRVVAIFKGDKFTVDDEAIDLSKSDRKALRKLRNEVVSNLKANDAANAARELARARQARFNKLNSVA